MLAMSTKMFEKVLGQIGIEKQIIGVKKRATAERWEIQVLRVLRWQSWDKILGGFQNQHVRKEKINAHVGKHHNESNNAIDLSAGARKL